jgi:2-dehydropantoate 2-reductase
MSNFNNNFSLSIIFSKKCKTANLYVLKFFNVRKKMRAAIYGAGSLGTVLGAYITKAGYQIDLINRNKQHIAALKQNGAKISGTVNFNVPVSALLPEEMNGTYDIIFLMTKQLDNDAVVKFLAGSLADDGVICTMQNGIPELSVSKVIGEARTYGCAIAWGAILKENGEAELTSEANSLSFSLGSFAKQNTGKHFDYIKELLSAMGQVIVEENFIGARFSKLLINCAFSGLSTVFGDNFGAVAKNKKSRSIAQHIIKECIDVAHAGGINIEPVQGKDLVKLFDYNNAFKKKVSFLIIPLAIKKHRLIKASMLQDIEKGKKCEVDAINGVLSEYGKKFNTQTPFNDKTLEIIRKIDKGGLKPSWDNISLYRR